MKLVLIEWKDARFLRQVLTLEQSKEAELVNIKTVGYVLFEDKEKIIIADEWCKGDNLDPEDGFRDIHVIPKNWVTNIKNLK